MNDRERFLAALRGHHPRFTTAILSDARVVSANRGRSLAGADRRKVAREALRLTWESDGFLAQGLYRAKAGLQARGIPLLPRLLHRLAISTSGIYIGDPVLVEAGVHLAHGQIVIDGLTEIGRGTTIFPFTTIGLRPGDRRGPKIGRNVTIGSGAKLIGPIEIGDRATVGPNSVVFDDVPAGQTVVAPAARPTERSAR
ncbi:MAG: DapH/DapD/GlmU-related protein [Solirubrobacterales bacterium]|jgi:serine O-acetyltransferase